MVRRFVAALIRDAAGRLLLVRRPQSAQRMAGFWELPTWELGGGAGHSFSRPLDSHRIPQDAIVVERLLGRVRHTITVNALEISVHAARLQPGAKLAGSRWVLPSRLGRLPVTTVTRKALSLGAVKRSG